MIQSNRNTGWCVWECHPQAGGDAAEGGGKYVFSRTVSSQPDTQT